MYAHTITHMDSLKTTNPFQASSLCVNPGKTSDLRSIKGVTIS